MSRLLTHALLFAAFVSTLPSQEGGEPAVDVKKARAAAEAAFDARDWPAAAAAYKTVADADAKNAEAWFRLGYALHAQGKLEDAVAVHVKASAIKSEFAPVAMYNAACAYSLLGKPDEAFAWLDKSVAAGFDDLAQLKKDTDFDPIRKDARFAKVAEAIAAKSNAPRMMAAAQNVERRNARLAWFTRAGSPGQVAIDYSPVPWKASYDAEIGSGKRKGEKWRLGGDFWTRLDSSVEMTLGGVAVPAGYYYLTIEQRDADAFVLALHDAAAVKMLKLDAFQAAKLKGGIEIPLAHSTEDKVADQLALDLKFADGSKTDGTFVIAFGGHRLSAPFAVKLQ